MVDNASFFVGGRKECVKMPCLEIGMATSRCPIKSKKKRRNAQPRPPSSVHLRPPALPSRAETGKHFLERSSIAVTQHFFSQLPYVTSSWWRTGHFCGSRFSRMLGQPSPTWEVEEWSSASFFAELVPLRCEKLGQASGSVESREQTRRIRSALVSRGRTVLESRFHKAGDRIRPARFSIPNVS